MVETVEERNIEVYKETTKLKTTILYIKTKSDLN